MNDRYDALLLFSFGGPEGPDDVMPFLENVTRGRGVPRERLLEVAEHYHHFGGVSPINAHNRTLIAELGARLAARAKDAGRAPLPIYWGNRNWHPYLRDTLATMKADGVERALVFVTSAFGSYSGCRQYQEDLAAARADLAGAPVLDKIRLYYDHPGFLEAQADRVREAIATLPLEHRAHARLVFTAHSVPMTMAKTGPYVPQLEEATRLVAQQIGRSEYDLVWQSRSGPPSVPWLEPDVCDHLDALADRGEKAVVIVPIGFLSDHMEVVWDLDHEGRDRALARGLAFARAGTVGTHPRFVDAIVELVEERTLAAPRKALGVLGVSGDDCARECCPKPQRPAHTAAR
ncbi:MAG: ferrochelatase [Sandaracinaceae bacterium]|nr:ferrochelatase [Sandaracinaceae bacterium]